MSAEIAVDVAVFGGGIAGLWTLSRLRSEGYRALLFESQALGGVQSVASQGIIHGGTKYALTGKLTGSAQTIAEMPGIWRAALSGREGPDLSSVRVLSENQYLWTTGALVSDIAGFFASKVMQSRMQPVGRGDRPLLFDDPGFSGRVYRLEEPVLDPASLAEAFVDEVGEDCMQSIGPFAAMRRQQGWHLEWPDGPSVNAGAVVLAAGAGNAQLLDHFALQSPQMQRRPLHMLMARGPLPMLYAHALGARAVPRLTVTSYPAENGDVIWYLGGQVAEEGVVREPSAQIEAGRRELEAVLPWLDISAVRWATLRIDRAEVASHGGARPDDAFVSEQDRIIVCWPTKLAFAPRVAQLVSSSLQGMDLCRTGMEEGSLAAMLPRPDLAKPPWEQVAQWS